MNSDHKKSQKLPENEKLTRLFNDKNQLASKTLIPLFLNSFDIFIEQTIQAFQRDDQIHYYTYRYFQNRVLILCHKLIKLGLKEGERVLIVSQNHPNWLLAEIATLMVGGITVPLNPELAPSVIKKIIKHCEPRIAFFQSKKLVSRQKEVNNNLGSVKKIILLEPDDDKGENLESIKSITSELGEVTRKEENFTKYLESENKVILQKNINTIKKRLEKITPKTTASLLYTNFSSSISKVDFLIDTEPITGREYPANDLYTPIAVTLSHGNIYSNLLALSHILPINFQDKIISILSPWNPMERVVSFLALYRGATFIHSRLRKLFPDLKKFQPTYLVALPRLIETISSKLNRKLHRQKWWKSALLKLARLINSRHKKSVRFFTKEETLFQKRGRYNGILSFFINLLIVILLGPFRLIFRKFFSPIMNFFGGQLKYIISGGRPLGQYLDDYFEDIDIPILEGYGLPEAGPVISIRRPKTGGQRSRRVMHTAGPLLENTDVKLIDPESGLDVSRIPGAKGIIYVRGPQIMKGYYLDEKTTREKMAEDDWFKTEDMGRFTTHFELQILQKE